MDATCSRVSNIKAKRYKSHISSSSKFFTKFRQVCQEVQNGYIPALDKFVTYEECAQVQSKLSQYINEHGFFGTLHATKDRERLTPIHWWNMWGRVPHICINWQ